MKEKVLAIIKAALSKALTAEEKQVLKDYQAKLEADALAAATPKEVKTTDGKTLSVTGEVKAGSAVTLDGKPAEGTFTLEDGSTLVVAGGVITEVKPKETPAEPMPAEMVAKMQAQHKTEIEAFETKLSQIKADHKKEIDEMKVMTLELTKTINKMLDTPIDTTLNNQKEEKKVEDMTNAELVRFNRGEKIYK